MKSCSKCKLEKELTEFYSSRTSCRTCEVARSSNWNKNNKEKHRLAEKKHRDNNKEKVSQNKKKYVASNWEKVKINHKKYLNNNSNALMASRLRTRLYNAIKKRSLGMKDLLGCDYTYLVGYLESKFQPGMSWDNYGQWHIDHITPLSSFKLQNHEQLKKACHYTNLQPLWAKDNLVKGNKL